MKIILAPSKTRNSEFNEATIPYSQPVFDQDAHRLAKDISHFPSEKLGKVMKIKDPILENTYRAFHNFETAETHPAILSYTGTVFKELRIKSYNTDQKTYLNESLMIMSALYGVLKPYDRIKHYRLDMTMKVMKMSLYKYWQQRLTFEHFAPGEPIICLASGEFAKMLPLPYINIEFKELKNGIYKVLGTYSKKARGVMANYLIEHMIHDVDLIKGFTLEGYTFNEGLSSDDNFVFTR